MSSVAISFTESALCDLEAMQSWYAEQGVPEIGVRLSEEVFQRIQVLTEHPDLGRIVPEFGEPILRELLHPPLRIVCRRDPELVRIVRIWRSERLLHLPTAGSKRS